MMERNRICMISIDPITNECLRAQLEEAFGTAYPVDGVLLGNLDSVDFESYILAVSTSDEYRQQIQNAAGREMPIITCERTIRQDKIAEILSLQTGTRVCVISNFLDAAEDTTAMLKRMGVGHLQLIPYTKQDEDFVSDVVITPSEEFIPPGAKMVINIGEKYIKHSTILRIFFALGSPESCQEAVIEAYHKEERLLVQYNKNMNELLWGTSQISEECILCIDNEQIFFCSGAVLQILEVAQDKLIGNSLDMVFAKAEYQRILSESGTKDHVIDFHQKTLLIKSKEMRRSDGAAFSVLTIQDITRLRHLEQAVQEKSKEKGFFAAAQFEDIIGHSDIMRKTVEKAKKFAGADSTVLIQGPNGTGKEIFAQSIHNASKRKSGPFVAVNLAALPDELALSELLGYEEGAFTGAVKGGKKGLFELANSGTIFLDEIGDISPILQQRLLRVLQEREVMPLGGKRIVKVDIRVIAATNRNLKQLVAEGKFREDLYYRLDVLSLKVEPLKHRKEDIEELFEFFMKKTGLGKILSDEAKEAVCSYTWPGNVRELENTVEYINCLCNHPVVTLQDLPEKFLTAADSEAGKAETYERNLLYQSLKDSEKDIYKKLLQLLEWAEKVNRSMGRRQIRNYLQEQQVFLSEDQIRNYLRKMEKAGLVVIGTTKQGSHITPKGRTFLGDILNK